MSSNTEFDNISFDLPKNQSNVIKVIGVGGGGSNAINHMFRQGIKGVDFVICNTDAQALENSPVPVRIQLGVSLTEGLGAGANPKIGEQSAVESMEEIKNMLSTNTKMIFITAGMGGGTGTGAAPIIAKMAKEMDILTVGIVTIPFNFEGKLRNDQAQVGVENLRQNVDSLVVINNNKLREVYGNLGFKAGFSKADEVLATAARGIAEVITHHYTQNIDLRDAKTVLSNSGTAIMGSAQADGPNRAQVAISKALDSPLLNDNKIRGAQNVLLLIVSGGEEITIDEIGEISDYIQDEAGHSANIIMGVGEDVSLEGSISITVIATGFNAEQQNEIVNTESKKIIHVLGDEQKAEQILTINPTAKTNKIPDPTEKKVRSKDESPIVRHTLFEEEEEEEEEQQEASTELAFEGYVETNEMIRNMEVTYEEVNIHLLAEFEQVFINEIDVNDFVIVKSKSEVKEKENKEKETMDDFVVHEASNPESDSEIETEVSEEEQILMFDLPFNESNTQAKELKKVQVEPEIMTSKLEEIEVEDHVEIVPITENAGDDIKRYTLDDYNEMESILTEAKPASNHNEDIDEEIVFEKKTIRAPETKKKPANEPADPLNSSISQILRDRTEERKRMMKDFNYKFRNSASKIDDIEKQPAYKRMGIELDDTIDSGTKISRTSVNSEDDNIELRSNNSFLHDNVD